MRVWKGDSYCGLIGLELTIAIHLQVQKIMTQLQPWAVQTSSLHFQRP
jgi:hypothetical protein